MTEFPALPPKDQTISSMTFTKLQLTRDRLGAQVSEAHRWRVPCEPLEQELRETEAHLGRMEDHNARIKEKHLRECAQSKKRDRGKQAAMGHIAIDQDW